ncbi:MAG TPA: hypothetical protein VHW23_27135 [Kofleriaceae bacterium]|nr:hypothetical protein [Kofleriaceae bacterium]
MLSYLLVAGLIALPVLYPLRDSLRGTLERAEQHNLLAQAREVAATLRGQSDAALLAQVMQLARVLQARVTVIDAAGHVIADSEVDPSALSMVENHASRPEVRAARAVGAGVDARSSATTGTDLVYAAVPVDPAHPDGEIVRIAAPRARVARIVGDVMLALRLGVGVGVSAALALSLIAVLSISVPLRRLRNVARAFAAASWVEVRRPRSGDELRDLADALAELGRQLRHQLVAVGAAEALVLQAVEALATPAALLGETFAPLAVNGALRMRADLTPDVEDAVLASVRVELTAAAGPRDLQRLPIRALSRGTIPDDARFQLTALARPDAPPLWLVVLAPAGHDGIPETVLAAAAALADAEAGVSAPVPGLTELRRAVSELIAAVGAEPGAPPAPAPLDRVVRTAAAGAGDAADGAGLELPDALPTLAVVDRGGIAVHAVRLLIQLALRAAGGRRLALRIRPDGSRVQVRIDGVAPDVTALARLGRLIGAEAHHADAAGREAVWLTLRRA